jgi:2-methylcitrate dehydratase PrpD
MRTYSEQLAEYIDTISFEDLLPEVVEKGKYLFLDTLGVMILGADKPWSLHLLDYFKSQGGNEEADVIFHGIRLPAANAAFVNGTMAHSFDYDDDLAACHIACCVIPAALATAQKVNASGKQLITAIVIGYDMTVRLAEALDGHHLYAMGFHPTAVCGTYGAVASSGKLLGLSKEQMVHAMGVAGSFVSGSLEWLSTGSMTKRFHGGKAASEGILASSLAQRGFTGPRTIYEGQNGILKMFRAQRDPQLLIEELSCRFDILKSYIKWYPCCTCNAPLVDAVLAIREETSPNLDQVKEIEARVRKTCMSLVGEPLDQKRNPQNILEAQMSAPYCISAALVQGGLSPRQFTMEVMKDPSIARMAQKVTVVWDPSLDVSGNPRPVPAEVIIKMSDGRIIKKKVDYQKGTYRNSLTSGEIEEKFSMCVKGKLSEKEKKKLIDWVDHLEQVEKLQQVRIGKAGVGPQ